MLYNIEMKLIGDISKKTWQKADEDVFYQESPVFIGFRDNGKQEVVFNNLSFGITAVCGDKEVSVSFPEEGVQYISTDQDIVEGVILETVPDEVWNISVWAENSGKKFQDSFSVTVARPVKLFDSWVWNEDEKMWKAPVDRPNDKKTYVWNEDILNWEFIETP